MEIKVLGAGCSKCQQLEQATRKAVEELNIQADIVKEQDMGKIMSYGITRTPALVVDGKVALSGRLAGVEEIKNLLDKSNK